jgi:hypothetical protein
MTDSTHQQTPTATGPSVGARSSPPEEPTLAATAGRAGDEAATVAESAAGAARDVRRTAAEEMSGVAGDAQQEARDVLVDVRRQLGDEADTATQRLAGAISAAAEELRSMAERSERPDGPVTEVVRQIADRSAGMAHTIETGGYRGLADELARFGRRRSGLFLLAAGAAGFTVGRVLRNTDLSSVAQAAKGEASTGEDVDDRTVTSTDSAQRPPVAAGTAAMPPPTTSGLSGDPLGSVAGRR